MILALPRQQCWFWACAWLGSRRLSVHFLAGHLERPPRATTVAACARHFCLSLLPRSLAPSLKTGGACALPTLTDHETLLATKRETRAAPPGRQNDGVRKSRQGWVLGRGRASQSHAARVWDGQAPDPACPKYVRRLGAQPSPAQAHGAPSAEPPPPNSAWPPAGRLRAFHTLPAACGQPLRLAHAHTRKEALGAWRAPGGAPAGTTKPPGPHT